MWASMLLPGIAGPPVSIKRGSNFLYLLDPPGPSGAPTTVLGGPETSGSGIVGLGEPMCDALVYEPIPYRSALRDGATHVLVCRTKPDGGNVCGRPSLFERLIVRRFWKRKTGLGRVFKFVSNMRHKKIYAEDILYLNSKTSETRPFTSPVSPISGPSSDPYSPSSPHVMSVALPSGSPEIGRTETGRMPIFSGVRRGFAAMYDAVVEDEAMRGRGMEIATKIFCDDIMDTYDPEKEGWEEWCKREGRDPWGGLGGDGR
ncbi:hypothetical protein TrRE_jg10165 [Triparma retinervis]|uniref:Uncharacterized protein n=1 Tax=Triparma retinervis TaxID=2557542 RepID=A0A9W7ASX8_9STRA|nr:hypothetical protein TrRE_jg10165 [Triparma retinervis]